MKPTIDIEGPGARGKVWVGDNNPGGRTPDHTHLDRER